MESKVVAHRGASHIAPENTLTAVQMAWDMGVDAVEIDIHLSKDNRIMVIHDETTLRTCGEPHIIIEHEAEFLRNLDAGLWKDPIYENEKIPFLEEVIATIPQGKKLFVEVKPNVEIVNLLKKAIENLPSNREVGIISYHWELIDTVKKSLPQLSCYLITEGKGDAEISDILVDIKNHNIDGIHIFHEDFTPTIQRLFEKAEIEYCLFTVDEKDFHTLRLDNPPHCITTNQPDRLQNFLSK